MSYKCALRVIYKWALPISIQYSEGPSRGFKKHYLWPHSLERQQRKCNVNCKVLQCKAYNADPCTLILIMTRRCVFTTDIWTVLTHLCVAKPTPNGAAKNKWTLVSFSLLFSFLFFSFLVEVEWAQLFLAQAELDLWVSSQDEPEPA